MKLPNRNKAQVTQRKLERYLLDLNHPKGGGKARGWALFGFTMANWQVLAERLKLHARTYDVASIEHKPNGRSCGVDGILYAANGRRPWVRSVWLVDDLSGIPRLVSAHLIPPPKEHGHAGT